MLLKLIYPYLRRHYNPILRPGHVNALLTIRPKSTKSQISKHVQSNVSTTVRPLGEKVKENATTASYMGIILLGVGVTGTLFYAVFKELFSSRSPNNIYTAAVKKCLADYRIEDKLGSPITAFGEETRRGRRQHPNYLGFIGKDGRKHIRMKFYLQGQFYKGTAQLELVENDAGDYNYKYLIVDINDLLQTRIIVEDSSVPQVNTTPSSLLM